jgi:hypothetical protein
MLPKGPTIECRTFGGRITSVDLLLVDSLMKESGLRALPVSVNMPGAHERGLRVVGFGCCCSTGVVGEFGSTTGSFRIDGDAMNERKNLFPFVIASFPKKTKTVFRDLSLGLLDHLDLFGCRLLLEFPDLLDFGESVDPDAETRQM